MMELFEQAWCAPTADLVPRSRTLALRLHADAWAYPPTDGAAFTKRRRSLHCGLPLVAAGASDQDDDADRERGEDRDADGFLKPLVLLGWLRVMARRWEGTLAHSWGSRASAVGATTSGVAITAT